LIRRPKEKKFVMHKSTRSSAVARQPVLPHRRSATQPRVRLPFQIQTSGSLII
jgi:hypothetical protein